MAFQRSHGTTGVMNLRNADSQKIGGGMDKKVVGKTVMVQTRQTRAALGNLSNRPGTNSTKPNAPKILKEQNELSKAAVPLKTKVGKLQRAESVKNEMKKDIKVEPSLAEQPPAIEQAEPASGYVEEMKESVVVEGENLVGGVGVGPPPAGAVEEENEIVPMDMSCTSQDGVAGGGGAEMEEAFSKQMWKLNVHDIDEGDENNPQLVSEYVNDIYAYMRELEQRFPIRPRCLEGQAEVNGRMRGILIDWLVQVHVRFQLLQETLYLTVSILDRYLQVENVTKNKLQLAGVAAMWLASKYEEMYAPEVADFVYITDNAYTSTEMRQMECKILQALDFQLGRPLPLHFLRRNSKAGEVDATMHTLAKYFMELTIVDYEMVHLKPSEIAAAALCLAIKLIARSPWTATLVYYSRYTESQLMPIMRKMASLALSAGTGKLTSIKVKYQSSKFMRISRSPVLLDPLLQELCDELPLITPQVAPLT